MWDRNIRVVIVPTILSFAFLGPSNLSSLTGTCLNLVLLCLATWLASIVPNPYVGNGPPTWSWPLTLTGLATSMTVNALVTGLIVFRIFKVFQKVMPTSDERKLGATGGRQIYSIMAIMIESGVILFSIQLARFVVTVVDTYAALYAFQILVPIHEILTVIITSTPLILYILILCWLQGNNTYDYPGAGVNGIVHP